MKFLTGDDTGILKWVRVEAQKVERLGPKRQGDAVHRLCWVGPPDNMESQVAVAYASGTLEVRDAASGHVIHTATVAPEVRCLHSLDSGLLAVSGNGSGSIVADWSGGGAAEPDANAIGDGEAAEDGPVVRHFTLPAPVSDARVDPCNPDRLAFGGGENDVKIYDLARGDVIWRAKNVRENYLSLRVPVKVSNLQWATKLATSRSLLICGTTDGKIRLYDASTQRRPLFELLIGHAVGQGSGGYTGAGDDVPRPVNCSAMASRGDDWSFFVGNTMGILREYDLRKLPTCKSAAIPPGRKSHLTWARHQMPFKRGYKGIMGSIRAVDVHSSGEALVAVGLGRFAYVFETRRRKMVSKIFMKQMMSAVLMSSEERKGAKDQASDDEGAEDDEDDGKDKGGEEADGPVGEDAVEEGFSSDEDGGKGNAEDGCEDEAGENGESGSQKKGRKRKTRAKSKVKARAKAGGLKKKKARGGEG